MRKQRSASALKHLGIGKVCIMKFSVGLLAIVSQLAFAAVPKMRVNKSTASGLATEIREAYIGVQVVGGALQCIYPLTDPSTALAYAHYDNAVNTTGWGLLSVQTLSADTDAATLAFAAGCAEAAVTYQEMFAYWDNYKLAEYGTAGPSSKLTSFMSQQLAWIRSQIQTLNGSTSKSADDARFWTAMSVVMSQIDGLVAFHKQYVPAAYQLDEITVYMLNSVGDLEELNTLFPTNANNAQLGATATMRAEMHKIRNGLPAPVGEFPIPLHDKLTDCSASVRILSDLSDVVVGHTTWRMYYAMLRTYKVYDFSFLPQQLVSFSSSPGLIHSKDDFYVTPQFVVMETTNSIFNQTLFHLYISPQTAFSWQRAYISNGWATSAQDWTTLFAMYNSGTYNNQWMVVDNNLFTPGSLPLPGFLWIIEQIPGFTHAEDVTPILNARGDWASYNIPYEKDIYTLSGYPAMVAQYGAQYTYENCSRANIFRRNSSTVESLMDLRALLRYNDYQNDPLAGDDPILGSVSSRGDLRSTKPVAFGGVDTKVTSMLSMTVLAESGPTYDQQPSFAWANFPSFDAIAHYLVPAAFKFPTITIEV